MCFARAFFPPFGGTFTIPLEITGERMNFTPPRRGAHSVFRGDSKPGCLNAPRNLIGPPNRYGSFHDKWFEWKERELVRLYEPREKRTGRGPCFHRKEGRNFRGRGEESHGRSASDRSSSKFSVYLYIHIYMRDNDTVFLAFR